MADLNAAELNGIKNANAANNKYAAFIPRFVKYNEIFLKRY